MPNVLIVTNDFPPRSGGIQSFVHALAAGMPAGIVTVYAPAWAGAVEFDARQAFPVIRHPGSLMLPVPSVARRAVQILREHDCDTVLFGAAAPLGLLAPALRRAGATRIVAITHGHEAGWGALPGARGLLRRIGDHVDVVTYLGEYFRTRLAGALSPEAADRMVRLAPGVDTSAFRPGAGGAAIRARLGLGRRPVVICVSRMVPRKGQDTLIRAWPRVLAATTRPGSPGPLRTAAGAEAEGAGAAAADAAEAPGVAAGRAGDPVLLLVGDGPYRADLVRLAERSGVSRSVVFAGPVPWEELPAYYDAGDVFAMPCRTRRRGLDVEGLGIVYLEASATGLPVIGGDSGGAPDAILDGETGFVVPGRSVAAVADRVIGLLGDPAAARAMGERGMAWVDHEWRWDLVADRLTKILSG
jgi:phosphatidylinositol alpha-1,6-mannosyltransferase